MQRLEKMRLENATEAAQIADRWKVYCADLYNDDEGNEITLEMHGKA